jgi:hypothetical protein
MKKINAPDGYTCYRTDEDELYALDMSNLKLFKATRYTFKSGIPEGKEVEGFAMDFDKETNTYDFNSDRKVTIMMNLLHPIAVTMIKV